MVYLFLGQDSLSKDEQLKQIKQQFFTCKAQQFNQDTLYGGEIDLAGLQEAFLRLPAAGASQRLIVIKDAQKLDERARAYLLAYATKPLPQIVLVLDISAAGTRKDEFVNRLARLCKVFRSKEFVPADTFVLGRSINSGRPDQALKILDQLLKNGEKPERILGGLRYTWEREALPAAAAAKRLKFMLRADMEIKTGRIKPVFALEKLVISLCGTAKLSG